MLEESADRTEQYSRRSNLLFSGFNKEPEESENTDGRIITLVNDAMKFTPPLQAHDIARSHRLEAPREGGPPPSTARVAASRPTKARIS